VSHGNRFGGVYGEAPNPGAPKTWNRSVWWALNRAARVGEGAGRHRWRSEPPFHYGELLVTSGKTRIPYGLPTSPRGRLTHLPHTILFAWDRGRLVGRMMVWQCRARTAYFRLSREPGDQLCQMCVFQSRGRVAG